MGLIENIWSMWKGNLEKLFSDPSKDLMEGSKLLVLYSKCGGFGMVEDI
jgi:hypothetical protein